jgi:mono/diheme cytochrome c family protein
MACFALNQSSPVHNPVIKIAMLASLRRTNDEECAIVPGRAAGMRRHGGLSMNPILAAMTLVVLVASPCGAHAQTAGDPTKGHQFVQQICSECHNTEKGQRPSPNGQAPNFETIARTPGMTAIALTAALRTPHRTMPNVIVADDDLRNVVAYVLSLQ